MEKEKQFERMYFNVRNQFDEHLKLQKRRVEELKEIIEEDKHLERYHAISLLKAIDEVFGE